MKKILFGGVLAAALIGVTFGTRPSGSLGETAAQELLSSTPIIITAAQSLRVPAVVSVASSQSPFAFGFLEFDWDPNAPGGVPGFDSWPKH